MAAIRPFFSSQEEHVFFETTSKKVLFEMLRQFAQRLTDEELPTPLEVIENEKLLLKSQGVI